MNMTCADIADLRKKISVMQAAADGKTIEFRLRNQHPGKWEQMRVWEHSGWNWDGLDYRVKAEAPRRIVVSFKDGEVLNAEWKSIPTLDESARGNLIEFIELTPDIKAQLGMTPVGL